MASLLSETVASSLEQTTVEGGLDEGDRKPPCHARGRGRPDGNSACLRKIARRRGPTAIPRSTCLRWMKAIGRRRRTQSASCSPRLRCGPEGFSSRSNGPRRSGPRKEKTRATQNEKTRKKSSGRWSSAECGVEGLIPGGKAIKHRQRCHQDEPVVGHCSSFLPSSEYEFRRIATWKNDDEDVYRIAG